MPRDYLALNHRHELEAGSKICASLIEQRGYWTATSVKELTALGFSKDQARVPALVIPVYSPEGEEVTCQAKPDSPRMKNGKPLKYETPAGSAIHIDAGANETLRQRLRGTDDLYITEGVKKGDAAVTQGLCCVSLLGVWNWRGRNERDGFTALPEWDSINLKNRRIYIVFDNDVMVKPEVAKALRRLASFLKRRGAKCVLPVVLRLPGESGSKIGFDDYFALGGSQFDLPSMVDTKIAEPKGIAVNNRSLAEVADDGLDALVENNTPPNTFVRDGRLVRVVYDERGVPKIHDMSQAALRGVLARSATWLRSGKNEAATEVAPPKDVVEDIMAMPQWEGIPPIISVTLAPVMAPSGTLRLTHGYCEESCFYVASKDPWPKWDGTLEEARDFILQDFLGDFVFADDASKANALAAMVLPIVRPAIDGPTPLHLYDAPVQGSGKSLLADLTLMATMGDHLHPTPGTGDEEEWRKKIMSSLRDGRAYIYFDNITHMVKSATLDLVLTAREFTDRRLGLSENVSVPIRCVWVMTSNNTELSRDLIRRTCWIRLDPSRYNTLTADEMERPQTRAGFRHADIRSWVRDNRPKIVAALCKLVTSWVDAGKPAYSGVLLGSYGDWCKTIGGILQHAEVTGFMTNLEGLGMSANAVEAAWTAFMARWYAEHGYADCKASALREIFEEDEELAGLLGAGNEFSRTTRLGRLIAKRVDRVCGGLKVVRSSARTAGSTSYKLVGKPHQTPLKSEQTPLELFEPKTDDFNGVNGVNGVSHVYARVNPKEKNQTGPQGEICSKSPQTPLVEPEPVSGVSPRWAGLEGDDEVVL